MAYLGNYKALTVPTAGFGLDGNAPEIAKAIDQAVADGMNVINLSIGEPAVAPQRDIVVKALENAAAAGVVPVVAAGNDFDGAGLGSIGSPANTPAAITVAASTGGSWDTAPDVMADFSSAGPAPISLLPKPDVTAPGVEVVSSVPPDGWAGLGRHEHGDAGGRGRGCAPPSEPSVVDGEGGQVGARLDGGSREIRRARGVDAARGRRPHRHPRRERAAPLHAADHARLGTRAARLQLGARRSRPRTRAAARHRGRCRSRRSRSPQARSSRRSRPTLVAGQNLELELTVSSHASPGDGRGFVVLTRDSDVRRVPFWFHVEVPKLQLDPHRTLTRPGVYSGNTAGKAVARVDVPLPARRRRDGTSPHSSAARRRSSGSGCASRSRTSALPSSVAAARLAAPRSQRRREPARRLHGTPRDAEPVRQLRPRGARRRRGPPHARRLRLRLRHADRRAARRVQVPLLDQRHDATRDQAAHADGRRREAGFGSRVHDAGAGVDRGSIYVSSRHAARCTSRYAHGTLSIPTSAARTGRVPLTVHAADYQELKNMEDVGPVLPNTRTSTRS